jgi:tRNA(fMet)-specific endonuclease VapC
MDPAILDTDIVSEVVKQVDPNVRHQARQYLRSHGRFTISAVTRFEVIRGYKALGATQRLASFLAFCAQSSILPVTNAEFDRAADLWVLARSGGHPCSDADLLIAATAIEHSLRLITGNTGHFAWIPGLTLEDWRKP